MAMIRLGDTRPASEDDKCTSGPCIENFNGIVTDPGQCPAGTVANSFRTADLPSSKRDDLSQLFGPDLPEVLYTCNLPEQAPTGPVIDTIQSGTGGSPGTSSPLQRWILIGGLVVVALWFFSSGKGD
jgi:hypothetical protein